MQFLSIKLTENPANGITVLVNLIEPSFNVGERLDARHVINNYHTVRPSVVATAQSTIQHS